MARYPKEHKAQSRARIMQAAGRRLKHDGIDGSGVATLMGDAGLTVGAFYAHFGSKDELVAATLSDQLQALHENLTAQVAPGFEGLSDVIRWYLSPEHRDERAEGCPNAALLDEIGRCSEATRQAYTDGLLVLIDGLASRFPSGDAHARRVQTLGLLGTLAGTLQLARAITDRALSDALLVQGVENALALVHAGR